MNPVSFQEILLLAILLAVVVPAIFFLITLQNTLKVIEPENRTMQPGKVWLLLIPLFNYVWMFLVVKAIADGLKNQFETYGVYGHEKPTYTVGIALCISSACGLIPMLGTILSIPVTVLWINYWIKVNRKRKELQVLKNTIGNADENSIFMMAS